MMPDGAAQLAAIRQRGLTLPRVILWVDSTLKVSSPTTGYRMACEADGVPDPELAWWLEVPEIVIRPAQSIPRLDLRCCVGLPVYANAMKAESEERLDQAIDRLAQCGAPEVWAVRLWLPADDERWFQLEAIDGHRV
jgi:hypothetical protein